MYNSFRRFILIIFISWSCNKSNHFINTNQPQHINIKDYGAIGDGISDDTQAFNLGMQKANSSHLPLYIPSGIYKASVLLSFDSLNIIGEKPAKDSSYNHFNSQSGNYYEPDFDDLSKKMRLAYENYNQYKKNAIEESEEIRANFSWKRIGKLGYDLCLKQRN